MPRRTVKQITYVAPQEFIYRLSCGHSISRVDLRIKRYGSLAQPKTAYCGECPATPAPAREE